MKPLLWIIAVIVLQGVVAAIAKKAQANAEAARRVKASGIPAVPRAESSQPVAPKAKAKPKVKSPFKKKPQPAPQSRPLVQRAPVEVRGGDSSEAMLSRQNLAASVAKVRAIEAKVAAGLPNVEVARPVSAGRPAPKLAASDLARALRNPQDIRRALILGEVLGKPRSATF